MKQRNQEAVLVKKRNKYAQNDVERKCMKL